jgi:anti-sigma factor RsiW
MNCRQAERHIVSERDSTLDDIQRAALARHVASCESCRHMQESLKLAIDSWRAEGVRARLPDADIEWQKLRRHIRGGLVKEPRSLVTWLAIPLGAAAAIAVGLYVVPAARNGSTTMEAGVVAARESSPAITRGIQDDSTVVFVDDKSGWTFVVGPQTTG